MLFEEALPLLRAGKILAYEKILIAIRDDKFLSLEADTETPFLLSDTMIISGEWYEPLSGEEMVI